MESTKTPGDPQTEENIPWYTIETMPCIKSQEIFYVLDDGNLDLR